MRQPPPASPRTRVSARAPVTRRPARGTFALSLILMTPLLARAEAPGEWTLVEGRVTVQAHRWAPRCGPLPEAGPVPPGARYLRRGPATLLPVDDARPLFGPGVCRALLSADGTIETTEYADKRCAAGASNAWLALRQVGVDALSVVQQTRLAPADGCRADVVGTWLIRRDPADPAAPPVEAAPPGSARALAPVAPPAPAPPPVEVPARTQIEVSARIPAPPADDPPARLPWIALAGLLMLAGVTGLIRGRRG